MRRLTDLGDARGYTLPEMLVVLAISSFLLSVLGMAVYQFSRLTLLNESAMVLSQQAQSAITMLNRDIASAIESTPTDDGIALVVRTHTFGQKGEPLSASVTYALEGSDLVRTDSERTLVVARHVQSITFTQADNAVTVEMTFGRRGQSRSVTADFFRRPSAE